MVSIVGRFRSYIATTTSKLHQRLGNRRYTAVRIVPGMCKHRYQHQWHRKCNERNFTHNVQAEQPSPARKAAGRRSGSSRVLAGFRLKCTSTPKNAQDKVNDQNIYISYPKSPTCDVGSSFKCSGDLPLILPTPIK